MSIGLALFNLFLYFSIRDSSYLLYFGVVLAQLWRTSDNGVAYEYFWPNSPFFEQVLSRGLSIIAVTLHTFPLSVALSNYRAYVRFNFADSLLACWLFVCW
ncbi:MAG: hypothetical protein IPP41_09555 [Rhodocyclaceae bacterium]|nr:hypothetical protein [Rhodocyclaceae bacterium]